MRLKTLNSVIATAILAFGMAGQAQAQATLVAQFDFDNNLNDQLGNASATEFGTVASYFDAGFWFWQADSTGNGGGLRVSLPDAVFTETDYSIYLKMRFTEVSGYRKIIDFNEQGADAGLYVNGSLRLYSAGNYGPTTWNADSTYGILITRRSLDDSTKTYLHVNNQLMTESIADDAAQLFVAKLAGSDRRLNFFFDDTTTTSEWSRSGMVHEIRIWNGIADLSDVIAVGTLPARTAGFSVFPNPAQHIIKLQFGAAQSGPVDILDATGRILHSMSLKNAFDCTIPVSEYPAGMYFVRVGGKSATWIKH